MLLYEDTALAALARFMRLPMAPTHTHTRLLSQSRPGFLPSLLSLLHDAQLLTSPIPACTIPYLGQQSALLHGDARHAPCGACTPCAEVKSQRLVETYEV